MRGQRSPPETSLFVFAISTNISCANSHINTICNTIYFARLSGNRSFRNRENLQYKKTAGSVLLNMFMKKNDVKFEFIWPSGFRDNVCKS